MKSINLSGLRDRKGVLGLLNEGEPFELLERKKVIAHFIPRKPQFEAAVDIQKEKKIPPDAPKRS